MKIGNLAEVIIAGRTREDLVQRRELRDNVVLYRGLNSVTKQLPPLRHACTVVSDVVALHDVAQELWASFGDVEVTTCPCFVALVPFLTPRFQFTAQVFSSANGEEVWSNKNNDKIAAT